jgi:hypothetical protein
MKKIVIPTLLAGLVLASHCALASPASDAANSHFQAIAAGDTAAVMQAYGTNPQLNWVGGPLDGVYAGNDSIRATWEKFAKAAAPLKLTVSNLEEAANPKGTTVTANVLFEGRQAIKVRYILSFRDGMLVNEIWQIDPKLNIAAN